MNESLKKIWNTVTWMMAICVALLAVLLGGVRLVGLTPYTVLSGSMEPAYPVGSLIYVRRVQPEEVTTGEPITFVLNENKLVATHRVIGIDEENRRFYTQGDANAAPDGAPVHFNNLIGKPVFSIPKLGYFSIWIVAEPGRYVGVCCGVIMLMLFFLPEILEKAEKADSAKTNI